MADIATLMGQSNCFQCLPPGQREVIGLVLLNNIAGGANQAAIDVNALSAKSACFSCLPPGQRDVIELVLLQNIATALGV